MTQNFAPLQRYWQQWEPQLKAIVRHEGSGARLLFPTHLKSEDLQNGLTKVEPISPVCIDDAPQKASSSKRGASHRLVILLNGSFELIGDRAHPCLKRASCNVTFLSKVAQSPAALSVALIDALHFDVESVDKHTPFHPTFHVQRGLGVDVALCKSALHQVTHVPEDAIEVDLQDNNHALTNPYFRLPTPQLDIFSVLTMITADYFCKPGTEDRFKGVLALLSNDKNVVRQGHSAMDLNERCTRRNSMSAAYWYPESR